MNERQRVLYRPPPSTAQHLALHPAWIEIERAAIAHNYHEIRRLVGPQTQIIASLKGNAYGHGIVEFARTLSELGIYSVATGSFQDALAIRQAGIEVKIQMFAGNLPQAIPELLRYDLMPTVYNLETAHAVSEAAGRPAPVYIKVDAGLGRLGVPIDEAESFVRQVAALPNVTVEGLYTHLPYNDASGLAWARPRLQRFDELVDSLEQAGLKIPVTQSIASAGIVCGIKSACSAVCTGHLLYGGLSRVTPDLADLSAFRPVLVAVKSRLIHIEHHPLEKSIGMGGSQTLQAGSTTGVIPVGAYDGYHKPAAGKRAVVLMRGQRLPVINVTLEYTTIDLTEIKDPEIGENVVLVGQSGEERIALEELAAWSNGGPLDALMSFQERLPYVYP